MPVELKDHRVQQAQVVLKVLKETLVLKEPMVLKALRVQQDQVVLKEHRE